MRNSGRLLLVVIAFAAAGCGGSSTGPSGFSAGPWLFLTHFTAFGDSITEGILEEPCPGASAAPSVANALSGVPQLFVLAPERAYPARLATRLRQRYTAQDPEVDNRGLGGERLQDGLKRLPQVLAQSTARVLLLHEGANNINQHDSADTIASVLGQMVREGRGRGMVVFVGTLLPQRPGACRAGDPDAIAPANIAIRAMASAEGAALVDLYAAFGGVAGTLIGPDGLHPTDAGNEVIAQTFFQAIEATLER